MPEQSRAAKGMRKLREKRRKAGFREILVWVPLDRIEQLRAIASGFCKDAANTLAEDDPDQLALFDFSDDETE